MRRHTHRAMAKCMAAKKAGGISTVGADSAGADFADAFLPQVGVAIAV